MRLEKIKLAGFKSFVDATTIPTPGNLVGIVGPNGCGKSNIIDAVRWVMGESSAKHLRGESMADVIFNGSSSRKPVGLASVELVFDNGEGKAPGEYATWPQIAIKRQVTRDGQSTYLLNGARCRRKDITDLFLGTGLGSRSYAIIEQGTISRLIEAKPAELRELIEEAAGISRYKERRHETHLRMGHTQENLDRLLDLRDEVGKQLESLKRQARKAEKYTELKQQERAFREQLLGLRWRRQDTLLQGHKGTLAECEVQFRALTETTHAQDEQLDVLRHRHDALQTTLGTTQARFYELGAEITRISQTLRHARETRETLLTEEARLQEERTQAAHDLEQDRQQMETLREEAAETALQRDEAHEGEDEAQALRDAADQALRDARRQFETVSGEIGRYRSSAEIQRARLRQLEQQARQFEQRRERLASERIDVQTALASAGLDELERASAERDAERADVQATLLTLNARIQSARERQKQGQHALNAQRAELHALNGRISSTETLQQHAMGKDRVTLQGWLAGQGLETAPRLAEQLDVEPGWETAVESVLGARLQALCVAEADDHLPALSALGHESVSLFETRTAPPAQPAASSTRLIDRVQSPWNLEPLLGAVQCATDAEAARALLPGLASHESVATPEGLQLGPGWLSLQRAQDGQHGVIRRERELRDYRQQQQALMADIEQQEHTLHTAEADIRDAEQAREQAQAQDRRLGLELTGIKAELGAARARSEQAGKRLRQLDAELDDINTQYGESQDESAEVREILLDAEDRLAGLESEAARHADSRGPLEQRLIEADASLRSVRDRVVNLTSRLTSLRASETLTARHLERAQTLYDQTLTRMDQLTTRLAETGQPDDDAQPRLDALTDQKQTVERTLADQRRQTSELEADIRRTQEDRLRSERDMNALKERLEQIRLELAANDARQQTVQEQFDELGADPATVVAALPEYAEEKAWQQRVTALGEDIARLGAVNLTAMEECLAQEERMTFLNQQHQDLTDSLDTLRAAIDTIDKECRTRFRDTFDLINTGLQRMFPKLFGGGHASLELTDRDLLETGVTVMARPPGKRNSSIHLLSGGEKALTAAALVFAIFELNPAPFCLLDEVDAPLDDANVGRFSQLVKEMSERVQFLFISHNKVTMEIADHLAGVTMREPGVSRIVAVDLDAAVEMATA